MAILCWPAILPPPGGPDQAWPASAFSFAQNSA